jgi:myo-inositol 2-dehydrogenase/D-chiro-inositol 1-dehydrogenase
VSSSNSPLKIGLIGAGRIGQLHAENLRCRLPEAQLVMVTDASEAAARACAERQGVAAHGTDYRQILARKDIEALAVCSPTDTHVQIIEEAAAAGKHIFCEKPIDPDLGRIDGALAAVRKAGVVFQVGFNRRFDASFARIRRAIVAGEIGTPHQLRITSRDPGPPPIEYVRVSGGIFMDMTIHDFDMAQFLIGDAVEEIYATGGVRVDPAIGEAGDLDTVTIVLKFRGGATGVIENCRKAVYGYDQRVEVFGSGGRIEAENRYPNTTTISDGRSVHRELPLHFFLDRYTDSYIDELRAFVKAVREGGPSPVSGEEARVPVVMALAARRSWKENRPVRLSEIG